MEAWLADPDQQTLLFLAYSLWRPLGSDSLAHVLFPFLFLSHVLSLARAHDPDHVLAPSRVPALFQLVRALFHVHEPLVDPWGLGLSAFFPPITKKKRFQLT